MVSSSLEMPPCSTAQLQEREGMTLSHGQEGKKKSEACELYILESCAWHLINITGNMTVFFYTSNIIYTSLLPKVCVIMVCIFKDKYLITKLITFQLL